MFGKKKKSVTKDEDDLEEFMVDNDLENDPELLKELAKMQAELGPSQVNQPLSQPNNNIQPQSQSQPKQKPKAQPQQTIDIPQLNFANDDFEVELTEEDMNDPDLLSQLSEISGQDELPLSNKPVKVMEPERVQEPKKTPQKSAVQFDVDDLSALMDSPPPKKNPNKQETQVKPESKQDSQVKLETTKQEPIKPNPISQGAQQPQQQPQNSQITNSQQKTSSKQTTNLNEVSIEVKVKSTNITQLEAFIQEEKSKALKAKKDGDVAAALEFMKNSKLLQTRIQELANPTPIQNSKPQPMKQPQQPQQSQLQQTNKQPQQTKQPLKQTQPIQTQNNPSGDLSKSSTFEILEKALESQISACQVAASNFYQSGDKETALSFHKEKKSFVADLEAVRSVKQHGGTLPQFHSEMKTYSYINQFPDLQENEMQLEVIKCFSIPLISGFDSIDSYVTYDLALPSEESPQTGKSPTVKGTTDPAFNFSVKLKIQRVKSLLRFIEKKKIVIELWHDSKSFFFLSKASSIGRVQIELNPLLTKCEIHEIVDILNDKRKPTGAKMEVRIRIRNPINGVERISVSEKWFYVDGFGNHPSHPPQNQQSIQSIQEPIQESTQSTQSTQQSIQQSTQPTIQPTTQQPQTKLETSQKKSPQPVEQDDEEEDPDSVDSIVSNMVMEWEIETLKEKIQVFKSKGQNPPDDIVDRLTQVEIKMNLLVVSVQTGTLSMDGYIASLKQAVNEEKEKALRFKKEGKLEFAKSALNRLKIMQKEIEEVESAE